MAIGQRTATGGTGATITLPTGTVVGDILVAAFANTSTGSATAPAGWTSGTATSASSGDTLKVFWAPYSAGLSLTFTTSGTSCWVCNAYTGADTLSITDQGVTAQTNTINNATVSFPASNTAKHDGDYELLIGAWTSAATITTAPAGFTVDKTQANSTSISVSLLHNNTNPAVNANGSVGIQSGTLSASNTRKIGQSLLLAVSRSPVRQSTSTEDNLTTQSFPNNALSGSAVVVVCTNFSNTALPSTCTDNLGNSYSLIGTTNGPSPDASDYVTVFLATGIAAGALTVTLNNAADIGLLEITGGITSVDVSNTTKTGSGTAITSNSVTTTHDGECVVVALVLENGSNPVGLASWTCDESQASAVLEPLAIYHQVQSTHGAISFSGTAGSATAADWCCSIIALSTQPIVALFVPYNNPFIPLLAQ